MIRFEIKVDTVNTIKRSSRTTFEGIDTRSRIVSDKTKYNRKRDKKVLDRW